MKLTTKILRWGSLFSFAYIVTEACLLLLERRLSGWARWTLETLERVVNFWDQGVWYQLMNSDWLIELAHWIHRNLPLNVGQVAVLVRALTYIMIGGTLYFLLGGLVGAFVYWKTGGGEQEIHTDDIVLSRSKQYPKGRH